MEGKAGTRRVVTFLTREELDFLDKMEKDMLFSDCKHVSRSKILENMAELLAKTQMSAVGVKSNEELKQRMTEAIIKMYSQQPAREPKSGGQNGKL